MRPYAFAEALVQGVIESRPNRFIMFVRYGDKVHCCHCPVTGDIAGLDFNRGGIPCLMSPNTSPKAKTDFTVEAISLDHEPKDAELSWIGINQNRANRYVEHFLRQGGLLDAGNAKVTVPSRKRRKKSPAKDPADSEEQQDAGEPDARVQRERVLGTSKIDFLIGDNHFCEVKSPLGLLQTQDHPNFDPKRKKRVMGLSDRLVRHFGDLSLLLETDPTACASFIVFFMYDAPLFQPPRSSSAEGKDVPLKRQEQINAVIEAGDRARAAGVSLWQLNTRFTPTHVHFISHFLIPPPDEAAA